MNSKLLTNRNELEQLQVFRVAREFIVTDGENKLALVPETLNELARIGLPLSLVANIGPYRIGKSYLMNRLARTKGFRIGNSMTAMTKGIWMKCLMHPQRPDQVLVLMDTEGLGDINKGDTNHDNRLFTLVVLLCSTLLYNCQKTFDNAALQNLTFITEISRNMKMTAESRYIDDTEFDTIFPVFVLCIRDSTLNLDGKTPTQHMEECLHFRAGEDVYNRPREILRRYFLERRCFVFDTPGSRKVLQKLEEVDDSQLSEDFLEDLQLFMQFVDNCPPKTFKNGKPITGRMIAGLAETYTEAMRRGDIPCVKDALTILNETENQKVMEEVVTQFQNNLAKLKLPQVDRTKLWTEHETLMRDATNELGKRLIYDENNIFYKEAMERISELSKKQKTANKEQLEERFYTSLEERHQRIFQKAKAGGYKYPGGHADYRKDIDDMILQFRREEADTEERAVALARFQKWLQKEENEILAEDRELTEQERIDQKEKMEREIRTKDEELLKQKMEREERDKEKDQQIAAEINELRERHERNEKENEARLQERIKQAREEERNRKDKELTGLQAFGNFLGHVAGGLLGFRFVK